MSEESSYDLIVKDLERLIQREGMTPERLEGSAPTITRVAGRRAYEVIRSFLERDDKFTVALRHALRLDPNNTSDRLAERRSTLLNSPDFPYRISENTLRRWEHKAILVLARQLEAMSEGAEPRAVQAADPVIEAINGLRDALIANTSVLREVNENLKRLAS